MKLESGKTHVRKLRARVAAGVDRSESPLRLDRAFGSLDFSVGLPAEAILCVRRFSDPLPGRVKPDGAPPPVAWREAVSESLRTAAMRAARPAREWVGANANVVLFADQAELLACLARDWCGGYAHGQWWWRLLFPALDLRDAVVQAWTENPRHVPAALCRLNQVDCASEFLKAIPQTSVARLLGRLVEVFGLDALNRELMTGPQSSSFEFTGSARTHAPAPWMRWVRVDPLLPAEPRQLLMIGLMLEQAPGVLRSPQFIRDCYAWQFRTEAPAAKADPVSPGFSNGQAVEPVSAQKTNEAIAVAPQLMGRANLESAQTERAREVRSPSALFQSHAPSEAIPTARNRVPPQSAVQSPDAVFNSVSPSHDLLAALPEPAREVVPTEWGGVFYLINVALAFGLYGNFTQPRQAGLAMPVWDLLTLLGRRMASDESLADPLWPLLARLSCRSEVEPPGVGFEPPVEWRVPAECLPGFDPGGVWCWSAACDRLRLRHPLGFFIFDVPRSCDAPVSQLQNEFRRFGADLLPLLQVDDGMMPARITDPLECWLTWLTPCFQARLASATGVMDATALRALVLRQRANVEVTADCVSVRFLLAEHPIELRMAGLDRDPGWVPAAGRRIAFHYD